MGRWEPDAPGRLERAAMELYGEQGFEQTTVAEIAERAGLTERTFFRHFADKREVLFSGSAYLTALLVEGLVAAPDDLGPLSAVGAALEAPAEMWDGIRERSRHRQAIIDANVELQERELIKMTRLADALTEGLRARGADGAAARLAAEAGIAVFKVAFTRWVTEHDDRTWVDLVRESMADLRAVAAGA